jgi:hypothetical protein
MKKLLVVTGLVLSSMMSYGQDRVNTPSLKWLEVSSPLVKADGWVYNKFDKKWSKYNNNLEGENDGYFNFYSLNINTINYRGNKYYVLVQKMKGHSFEYPAIYRGYYSYTTFRAFAFTESDFNKIKNIELGETITLATKTQSYLGNTTGHTEKGETLTKVCHKELLNDIRNEIDNVNGFEQDVYVFKIKKTTSNGKVVYRFITPYDPDSVYSGGGLYTDFEKMYYEVSSLNELLTLKPVK